MEGVCQNTTPYSLVPTPVLNQKITSLSATQYEDLSSAIQLKQAFSRQMIAAAL